MGLIVDGVSVMALIGHEDGYLRFGSWAGSG
jgi:hypothetical protein